MVSISQTYNKDGIVLMENSESERTLIMDGIKKWCEKHDVDIHVEFAENEDEVISLCKSGYHVYIVDINMGLDRQEEGLNALERIRKIDSYNFVAVLSGNLKHNKWKSILKKADVVQRKTGNISEDIETILCKKEDLEFIHRKKCEAMLQGIKDILISELVKIDSVLSNLENLDLVSISSEAERLKSLVSEKVVREIEEKGDEQMSESILDPNLVEYQNLRSDPSWLKKNEGKYVAIVEGKLFRISEESTPQSGDALLEWLLQKKEYRNKRRFFTKVARCSDPMHKKIIDEPMSFSFDDFNY